MVFAVEERRIGYHAIILPCQKAGLMKQRLDDMGWCVRQIAML